MSTAAIIVAAGRGTRAGGGLPKQWQNLAGQAVLDWSLAALRNHPAVEQLVLVHHPDDRARVSAFDDDALLCVEGGETRSQSVQNGLRALRGLGCTQVLIHDAARPCVSARVISDVIAALQENAAAAPGLAITDALWQSTQGVVTGAPSREGLFRAQTPQGFDYAAICAAYAQFDGVAADDVSVARAAGIGVAITPGDEENLKITMPGDFTRAERILRRNMDIRLGNGFDVHRFGAGDHLVLCGVKLPHERGLEGHSDADVGLHAISDAIYGALAMGDIGRHFPPSDPQWKGAASDVFLRHAVDLAAKNGFSIGNIDCTLICELPKITPHAAKMQQVMAQITGVAPERISIKATTSERLGFTGREEGIAALATVTLIKP